MDARVLTIALVLGGCWKDSKRYCEQHPTDLENCGYGDAGVDARPTCMADPDCAGSPGAPYCEVTSQFCVECYLPEHCAGNADETFCDLDTFRCTSCVAHADCASGACLPSGECGDDATVAYVDPAAATTNTACTSAQKCATIALALATGRPYIKLQGAIVETIPKLDGDSVTFIAEPGTTLTRSSSGIIIEIANGSDIAIYDLAIIGNGEKGILVEKSTLRLTTSSVTGCNVKDKRAIEAKMGSTLVMSRSTISSNAGGGIVTDGATTFNITNNFIYRNGANDTMVGGASFGATTSGLNRFEMNTLVDNRATTTADAGGLYCASTLRAPNNLIVRNLTGGLATNLNANKPVTGGCNLSESQVATDVADFAFTMPDGGGPWNYHVGPGSMAIDRGVATDLTVDFDGNARPYNAKVDVGADEYTP
jgi:hypothetical protein